MAVYEIKRGKGDKPAPDIFDTLVSSADVARDRGLSVIEDSKIGRINVVYSLLLRDDIPLLCDKISVSESKLKRRVGRIKTIKITFSDDDISYMVGAEVE